MIEKTLKELHFKHGYYVSVESYGDNGIKVIFPNSIVFEEDNQVTKVIYDVYNQSIKKYINECTIPNILSNVPEYAIRTLIATDIILMCSQFDMDSLLVIPFDKEGNLVENGSMFDLLKSPTNEEMKNKESAFKLVFQKIWSGNNCASLVRTNDIEEGYNLLNQLFTVGGI